ncbi:decaprenylphospho-beta-D-erythro-pentofuranosid-2-ulose 2-reductase [Cellulomonas aerilata]|uniref:Decaprenylphospho-beta-D-erythro-pentofuranosid-2-ulose 2-reductase n=1 Tax=Cellulomonas aerilata TaxID=515326 RepID=A0A512D8J5_9CELL|nr:decaprenylphospho-beta-D-erythro-pentofuranosid-2-ulose 2-reductase [Cellulomonas aerilata]GEO32814.1 decaprenylphospho-beta-D-erythro-pentofuranosid-2 -ulose 2-reductase [Cellulomonas aerilata]
MDAVGTPQSVLLLGGTSEIGLATVRALVARRPARVVLAARPSAARDDAAAALGAAGHAVTALDFDARDTGTHPAVVDAAFADGDVDVAVVAFGVLGDQERAWQDHDAALEMFAVNTTAAVSVGVLLGARMAAQGHGAVVALSSVAGERPRRSNFVYGASKSGMDAFYTGLREALRPDGVRVLVVRPGFVRTAMTEGLKPAPLATDADAVATLVVAALVAGKETVWAPPPLRWVMSALRHVPAPIFRRLPI